MTNIFSSSGDLDYPQYFPDTSIDFINNRSIPPEYTFTRNSAGTYVGADGYIKTAAANEPRFDYDPITGEFKGLLVEESRTNYYTTSETMTGGRLFRSQWTWTSFTEGGPQGGSFMRWERISPYQADSEWNYTIDYSNTGLSLNDAFVVSFYARCPNGTLNSIRLTNPDAEEQFFNLISEWQRFTAYFTYGVQGGLTFFRINRSHAPSFVVGSTYDIAGLQIENKSFPTSYIPTSGSAVTRQPDQLILNKPLNSLGTFFVESTPTTGTTLSADNGTSGLVMSSAGKEALYYNTNRTLRMSSDSSPASFNSLTPQNLNRVSLGHNVLTNSNYINGYLKKFMYYGSPVTEDNLRSLTGNTKVTTLQT